MAEIAIIGGGPAGLACAISLAMRDKAVRVFEPRPLPIDKPCGEGIMPHGVALLKKLGIFGYVDREQSTLFEGVCLINEAGDRAYSQFGDAYGLGCRRLALSTALYRRCLDFPSITFHHEKIHDMEFGARRITIRGDVTTMMAHLVIGADGLRSRVRAWAGLKGEDSLLKRYGLRQHFAIAPWSNFVEVYFRRGIEAYITPCGGRQTNITFLWSKDLLPETSGGISFDSLIKIFPEIAARIRGKTPLSEQLAIGPLHQRCRHIVTDGIALVGDASGYYDAITGEGISIALLQAEALADTIARIGSRKRSLIKMADLLPYAALHKKIVRSYYQNTGLLLWCARKPRLMRTIIRVGSLQPFVFSRMLEASRRR